MSSIFDFIAVMCKDRADGNSPEDREIVCGALAFKLVISLSICRDYLISLSNSIAPDSFYLKDRAEHKRGEVHTPEEAAAHIERREKAKRLISELVDLLL